MIDRSTSSLRRRLSLVGETVLAIGECRHAILFTIALGTIVTSYVDRNSTAVGRNVWVGLR